MSVAKTNYESGDRKPMFGRIKKLLEEELEGHNSDDIENAELEKICKGISKDILKDIMKDTSLLEEHIHARKGFEKRNWERWKEGLQKFEMFLDICRELGEEYGDYYVSTAVGNYDPMFIAIQALHARSCLVASEIYALMLAGFADGALARWRTLHEHNVTAMFLAKGDQELAERYLRHEDVVHYKWMVQFNKHCERLGQEPIDADEIKEITDKFNGIKEKYDKSFCKLPYGWASKVISNANFYEMEKFVGLDKMRPYYLWANQKVHAGHKVNYADLGLSEAKEYLLLVGQSNSGMTDPAHCAALSLMQITTTFLLLRPEAESIVFSEMLITMEEEIGEVFGDIQNQKR